MTKKEFESFDLWIKVFIIILGVFLVLFYMNLSSKVSTPEDTVCDSCGDFTLLTVDARCTSWKRSSWEIAPEDPDKLADYAAKLGLLTEAEWENREILSACDCAMYLYVNKLISKEELQEVYDPEYCHEWAIEQAGLLDITT